MERNIIEIFEEFKIVYSSSDSHMCSVHWRICNTHSLTKFIKLFN